MREIFQWKGVPVLLLLSAVFMGCESQYNKMKFDSASWKADVTDRSKMVVDLRKNHLKIGMSSTEIESLLGKPERIIQASEYGKDVKKDFKEDWRYAMSINDCFDCHHFVIRIDTNGNYQSSFVFCK